MLQSSLPTDGTLYSKVQCPGNGERGRGRRRGEWGEGERGRVMCTGTI